MLLKNDSNNLVKRLIRFRRRCLNVFEKIIGYSNSSFTTGLYFVKASDEEITEAINKAELARHTSLNVHQTGVYNEAILEVYEREKYLEKMMETSISNEEFKLYYLPKYEINSLEMVGLEVLTRWHSPLEIISPSEYIPLFEKNGFIDKLTYYIVEQVAKTLKDWQERGLNILPVAINVSYNTLINRQFVTNLIQIVDKYEIDHKLIEIELQELVFKENVQSIVEALNKVRSAGFNTTIDDFGTGYSSLVMLKALPVDTLKLDKVFLKNGIIEENDYIIIKNIINMSKELGIKIVSEGVETEEQLDFLKKSGCQYVQGFYLCRPVMLEELEKKMKKN
jgi:EAL domain-containing protein (putative c-di-GMP-specific phosphodiesterase class I)